MTVSLSENQLSQIESFCNTLPGTKNRDNFFIGKCGEVAFHNFGIQTKLFKNFYGEDLFNSVLKNDGHADLGHDYIMQSMQHPFVRIFAQIKTTPRLENANLILSKDLYDGKLNYYNGIPQDIFVFIRMLSRSTYDIVGYIDRQKAIEVYTEDKPVSGCYCINEKKLNPIETLVLLRDLR